jgi:hypothetical protein
VLKTRDLEGRKRGQEREGGSERKKARGPDRSYGEGMMGRGKGREGYMKMKENRENKNDTGKAALSFVISEIE